MRMRMGGQWRGWDGPPARLGAVIVGAGLLLLGFDLTSFPTAPRGRMPQVLLGLVVVLGAVGCLLLAGARVPVPERWRRWYARGRWVAALAGLGLSVATFLVLVSGLYITLEQPATTSYTNDVIVFTQVEAEAVLAGRNPYTNDAEFATALRRYPNMLATPLRRGAFSASDEYPSRARIERQQRAYLADPGAARGEFDAATLHSYPALAFLLYVPLVWAGLSNIILAHLVIWALLGVWLVWQAPVAWRGWAALAAAAGFTTFYSLALDSEVVCVAFVLAAWHWRERRWLSSLALGLGCAFKQYCWFFAPFVLLEAWLTRGWREAARRGAIAAGAFLLPNLPFVLASPGAWARSLFLPLTEPLYPMGVGPITLSVGHLLPFGPPALYTMLELLAFAGALWLQWRERERLGAGVLVLALVPLLFAFRSPSNYFAFLPWLALYAACQIRREDAEDAEGTEGRGMAAVGVEARVGKAVG